MIHIVVIEDEVPAQRKIIRFLNQVNEEIMILAVLNSVAQSLDFFATEKSKKADVIISDIQLLDGNAFDIFQQIPLYAPIVFTTAYDSFLMQAFESNGIAYLLKPFSQANFQKAWDKFLRLKKDTVAHSEVLDKLKQIIAKDTTASRKIKKRFAISHQKEIYFLEVADITFFEAEDGVVFAYDVKGKKHLLTQATLKEIEIQTDPIDFFRINRSQLINKKYIERMQRYNKNTLAIKLYNQKSYLTTSQNKTAAFKNWIDI
ncbi:MAG: response regulator transcription factor [Bernardetiaceae bacterium]|nr:response regulator transcription factor [Bernardetiaceae bacterium]